MLHLMELGEKMKELELSDPSLKALGEEPIAKAAREALSKAKAACDAHGPLSAEADAAWDELDAASHHHLQESSHPSYRYSAVALMSHHNYNSVIDPQLLSDAIKAFETIEALSRFVRVEKNRLEEETKGVVGP